MTPLRGARRRRWWFHATTVVSYSVFDRSGVRVSSRCVIRANCSGSFRGPTYHVGYPVTWRLLVYQLRFETYQVLGVFSLKVRPGFRSSRLRAKRRPRWLPVLTGPPATARPTSERHVGRHRRPPSDLDDETGQESGIAGSRGGMGPPTDPLGSARWRCGDRTISRPAGAPRY